MNRQRDRFSLWRMNILIVPPYIGLLLFGEFRQSLSETKKPRKQGALRGFLLPGEIHRNLKLDVEPQ